MVKNSRARVNARERREREGPLRCVSGALTLMLADRETAMHATTNIRISLEKHRDGIQLARAAGDLDALGAPVLREYIDQRILPGHDFVLDLDEVTFLGSAGMKVLIDTDDQAARRRVRWALVGNHRPVARPLWATGLSDRLPLQPDVPAAIRELTSPPRLLQAL